MRFSVQYPKTLAEGLAGKTFVEKPMLFVFPEIKVQKMWMKGMLIPIDIIFADENGKIVKIYREVPPIMGPKYSSVKPCKYAIECAAGDASRLGMVEGYHIRIFGDPANLD